jgi:hypothetical protein
LRILVAVVSLGFLCLVPHAVSERFPAALGDRRDFVLESSEVLLLIKLTVFQVSITEAAAVASFAVSL